MPFSNRLKTLRKAAHMTQEQLALACGFSGQSRIANYEQGTRNPTLEEIPVIAAALGVSIGDLFGQPDKPAMNASAERDVRSIPVRLDPSTLAYVRDVLDAHYKEAGRAYDFLADPEMLGIAYAFVANPKELDSLKAFTSALDARLNQGEAKDGKARGTAGGQRVRKAGK